MHGLLSSCGGGFFFFLSLSSCGTQAPECMGSVVCGTRALVEARELSSCGVLA